MSVRSDAWIAPRRNTSVLVFLVDYEASVICVGANWPPTRYFHR
jgi:hypothetical protein